MVLCKTCEAEELKCVVFLFLCVVNLKDGATSMGLSNLFGLRGLCNKVQYGTWVLVEV